jgi:hypothetical protein
VQLERRRESHIILRSSARIIEEASLAQEIHGHIENVCLTGGVVIASFVVGLGLTGVIFWWALFASHGAG